jgi:leucyl/phenylalanyl-tRNA--protein transferase
MPAKLAPRALSFPDPRRALRDPNGLLAIGGDLSPQRLELAYRSGIFPWYDASTPILWWSPDPRAVLYLDDFVASRSLRRRQRRDDHTIRVDTAFAAVVDGCAAPRRSGPGTWITREMRNAYLELHRDGVAHSFETWMHDDLVGGLYGLSFGRVFFGESMFARATDASKLALAALVARLREWGFAFIDCQVMNGHMASLGAREVPREQFLAELARAVDAPTRRGSWS